MKADANCRSELSSTGMLNRKLEGPKIAIVGVGATGSYVLDLVAKTPVAEIHLFDRDMFLNHNAFRSPGAPSLEDLSKKQQKVNYLAAIYAAAVSGGESPVQPRESEAEARHPSRGNNQGSQFESPDESRREQVGGTCC